ncbi:hypothetical protein PHI80_44 [Enterobacteria phage phi80]|nr:hypothetical protein ABF05_gp43 [Enterobacteria phage phi80]ACB02430.1 hypothetical protein ECDH10B_1324 [Escherichia coli str. K-12 substr. DH10B]AFV29180.1 hypothetical protein PHI80_44 [Enterobacteria phage phi80]KGM59171.1 hypothetical protein EL76_2759 [Escherichia coli G3/10]KGM59708.1 hypothetical protein EL76_3296 [Escherichia coli G3/10]
MCAVWAGSYSRWCEMTVTHNGKQYTAKKLNDNEWQLTSVSNPREKLTMNRWHMKLAGLLEQVEVKA